LKQWQTHDLVNRMSFYNWMHCSIRDALIFFTNGVLLQLLVQGEVKFTEQQITGFTRIETNKRGSTDSVIGIWCGVSSDRIIGLIFLEDTINSELYV
jgi:hypothetical protein